MEVKLTIIGDNRAKFELDRVAARATDMGPILRVIGHRMLRAEKRLFETSGWSAGGERWAPLKPATIKRKKGTRHPTRPLTRTGEEMLSFSRESHPDNIFRVGKTFVEIGSKAPGVPFQKTGTRHMVARPPIRIAESAEHRYKAAILKFVVDGELSVR